MTEDQNASEEIRRLRAENVCLVDFYLLVKAYWFNLHHRRGTGTHAAIVESSSKLEAKLKELEYSFQLRSAMSRLVIENQKLVSENKKLRTENEKLRNENDILFNEHDVDRAYIAELEAAQSKGK